MFIFILGLGPICDEFRIWASNLVLLFIESLCRFCISYLFRVYFVSNHYFVVKCHVVPFRIVFCFRILFMSNVVLNVVLHCIVSCLFAFSYFKYFIFYYDSYLNIVSF